MARTPRIQPASDRKLEAALEATEALVPAKIPTVWTTSITISSPVRPASSCGQRRWRAAANTASRHPMAAATQGQGLGPGTQRRSPGHPDWSAAGEQVDLPGGHDRLLAVGRRLDLWWVGGAHPVRAVVVPDGGVVVADTTPVRRCVGAGVGRWWRRVDTDTVEVGGRRATVLEHPVGSDA